jgi:hypothetical protein
MRTAKTVVANGGFGRTNPIFPNHFKDEEKLRIIGSRTVALEVRCGCEAA